ncbi:MAG: response regulator [Pseudomonadota bacterium]|nr:response regulator [Pseudomonadota bacterium]
MAKRILVVDDSESLRQIVGIALRRAGYEIVEARNGQEALAQLDTGKLHLIISDVNMPIMNGLEFVKHVRRHASAKFTPVVMLTTEGQEDMKRQGKEAGAKAWISKPFNAPQLLEVVSKLVLP